MRGDWTDSLTRQFLSTFPDERSWRTIGREAEFPIVHADGSMADIRELWPRLAEAGDLTVLSERDLVVGLEGRDFTFAMEVGLGTVEIICEPRDDLGGMASIHEAAVERLVRASEEIGVHVLGYGIQPKTPASTGVMSPKSRYGVIHDVLGELWLWFTLTASDQIHVAASGPEMGPLTDLCNALSGVTIALCANSSVFAGTDSGLCSGREGHMGAIGAEVGRHGMPLRPAQSMHGWIAGLAAHPVILRWAGSQRVAGGGDLESVLARSGGPDTPEGWNDFLLHDHYIWNSARPRHKQATIELRAACQQPGDEHMVGAALHLGMVAGAPQLGAWLVEHLGGSWWSDMRRFHDDAVELGLDAPEPFEGFLSGVLDRCANALDDRGRGEAEYLRPLYDRLERRRAPAQDVRSAFGEGGMAAVVALTAIR